METRRVHCIDCGLLPYDEAFRLQQHCHQEILKDPNLDAILLKVEHPPIITLGKNAPLDAFPEHTLHQVAITRTDRGGLATAHNPGQLVVYPIVHLKRFSFSVRTYVSWLEQSVMDTLSYFHVSSFRREEYPGVWLSRSHKICALGVRIKQHVSMHGLALNVCNDLGIFNLFTPCGISGTTATSLSDATGKKVTVSEAWTVLKTKLIQGLKLDPKVLPEDTMLQWENIQPRITSSLLPRGGDFI